MFAPWYPECFGRQKRKKKKKKMWKWITLKWRWNLTHLILDIYSVVVPLVQINEWMPHLGRNVPFLDAIPVIVKQLPALCQVNHDLEMSASVLTLEESEIPTQTQASISVCSDNEAPSVPRSNQFLKCALQTAHLSRWSPVSSNLYGRKRTSHF